MPRRPSTPTTHVSETVEADSIAIHSSPPGRELQTDQSEISSDPWIPNGVFQPRSRLEQGVQCVGSVHGELTLQASAAEEEIPVDLALKLQELRLDQIAARQLQAEADANLAFALRAALAARERVRNADYALGRLIPAVRRFGNSVVPLTMAENCHPDRDCALRLPIRRSGNTYAIELPGHGTVEIFMD